MNTATLTEEYASGNRNFQGRHLSGVNLGWATLAEANFRDADFYGANLSGASLKQADLSGKTNLAFADLSRADLTSVDLRGANLEGANLDGTVLDSAVYDEHTIFPRGFDPDTAGAITAKVKLEALMLEQRLAATPSPSATIEPPMQQTPQPVQQNPLQSNSYPQFSSASPASEILPETLLSPSISESIAVSAVGDRSSKKFIQNSLISIAAGAAIAVPGLFFILRQNPPTSELPAAYPIANTSRDSGSSADADSPSKNSPKPQEKLSTNRVEQRTQEITKQEAVELSENWLKAKESIFGSNYNAELVGQLTTGKVYNEILATDGSLSWLKQNNAYYRYGQQSATPLSFFSANSDTVLIDVNITEDLIYYENNEIQKRWTNSQPYRFTFTLENGKWKLSDRQKISGGESD
jgi:hypothetical protein